jgi:hypothetical protein
MQETFTIKSGFGVICIALYPLGVIDRGIEEDRVWSPEEHRTYHFLGLTIHHQSQVFVIDLSDTTQPVWFLMRGTLGNDVTWETLSKALLKFRQDNFLRIKSNLFSELRVYLLQIL